MYEAHLADPEPEGCRPKPECQNITPQRDLHDKRLIGALGVEISGDALSQVACADSDEVACAGVVSLPDDGKARRLPPAHARPSGQEDFDSIELYEERAVHAGTRPEYSQNAANPSLAMLNAGQRQSVVSSGYSRNHGSTYIAPTENSLEGGGSLSDLWSFTKSTKLDQRTQVNRLCGAKAEVYGAFGLSAVFRGYGGHKQITLRMESEKHLRQNLP
jgi:hypothetical protein